MKKKLLIISFCLAVVLILVAPSAEAITFGTKDTTNQYPYVGTLLFETPSGFYSCSGTLLTPKTMLTAGHCVEEGGVENLNTWVSFEPEIKLPQFGDYDELTKYLNKNWLRTQEVIPHPNYSDYAEFPNTYDIGLVILQKPYHLGTFGELPSVGLLESVNNHQRFTAVGYGLQGYIPSLYFDDWARYYGTVSLVELNSFDNGDDQSAKFTNSPGGGNGSGGTCFGDSGGPVFLGNTNVVAAIVSWGITPCIGVDYQFRVDTALALDFVYANWR